MAETFFKRAFGKFFQGRSVGSKISVGAFGKHPGYPEHFEDLNGESALLRLREQLYTRGVQAAVDTGVWKELDDGGLALPFRHTLIWRTGTGSIVVGRMLASRDKLGRDKYPIMVVAISPSDSLEFAMTQVLPWVEGIMSDCVGVLTLDEVKSVIQQARQNCPAVPAEAATVSASEQAAIAQQSTAFLTRCDALGPDSKGLVNIIYQVHRDMAGFAPASVSTSGSWTKNVSQRPAHIRVPRCGNTTADTVAVWLRLLSDYLADSAPILLMVPDAQPDSPAWVDIVVGVPTEAEFFFLRASTQTTPCTSDIPYTIAPEFEVKTRAKFKAAVAAYPDAVSTIGSERSAAANPAPASSSALGKGKLVALLLVSLSILIAFIAWKVTSHSNKAVSLAQKPILPVTGPVFPTKSTNLTPIISTPAVTLPAAVVVHPVQPLPSTSPDPPAILTAANENPAKPPQLPPDDPRQIYISDLYSQKGPFTSATLNQVWCDRRDNFLHANTMPLADLKTGMQAVTAPLTAIDTNPQLHQDPDLNWPGDRPFIAELKSAIVPSVVDRRNTAINTAARSVGSNADAALPLEAIKAIDGFATWEKNVERLGIQWIAADALLNTGAAVDEADPASPAGSLSAADIADKWKSDPVLDAAEVRTALIPINSRIADLLRLRSASREKFIEVLSTENQPFEKQLAAWRGLAKLSPRWPGNTDEWTTENKVRHALLASVVKLQSATPSAPENVWKTKRLDQVTRELNVGGTHRWTAFATDLPADASDIDRHLTLADTLADSCGIDRSQIAAQVQYNLAVCKLRNQLAALGESPDDQKIHDTLESFCAAVELLKINAGLISQLRAELAVKTVPAPVGGAIAIGPESAGFKSEQISSDEIVFTPPGPRSTDLHFIRLTSADGSNQYLCTMEMTVGLFISTVDEKGSWDEVKNLLPIAKMSDNRLAPRTWVWANDRMEIAPSWMPSHVVNFADYPVALVGSSGQLLTASHGNDPAPTLEQPIQFVSPKAAVYVASLLGCRLPTAGEWATALKMDDTAPATQPMAGAAGSPAPPATLNNLRDRTWSLQKDYYISLKPAAQDATLRPDAGIFNPLAPRRARPLDEATTVNTDDGILWFRRAGLQCSPQSTTPHRFSDLVGNVGEFVNDPPIPIDQWPASAKSIATAKAFVESHAHSFCVIGGSALSPPELSTTQPYPVDVATTGFSDTGFRLAFTAAEIPFKERALAIAKGIQYLPVKSPAAP